VRTSEHEHKPGLARVGVTERAILLGSGIAAWGAFPAAALVYLAHLRGYPSISVRSFDELEIWLLCVACVGLEVASLRADDPMIEHAWHEGLRLGTPCDTEHQPRSRVRFFGRPCVWTAMGYIACMAWTAAATVTYLVVRGTLHPTGSNLVLGMGLLLIPAVQGTVVRLVGPGLTRIRAAYDAALEAHQTLQRHSEVYEYLKEIDGLELFELLQSHRVLEIIQAVNVLIEKKTTASEGAPHLSLVETHGTCA
jgi:hypothetical protein